MGFKWKCNFSLRITTLTHTNPHITFKPYQTYTENWSNSKAQKHVKRRRVFLIRWMKHKKKIEEVVYFSWMKENSKRNILDKWQVFNFTSQEIYTIFFFISCCLCQTKETCTSISLVFLFFLFVKNEIWKKRYTWSRRKECQKPWTFLYKFFLLHSLKKKRQMRIKRRWLN